MPEQIMGPIQLVRLGNDARDDLVIGSGEGFGRCWLGRRTGNYRLFRGKMAGPGCAAGAKVAATNAATTPTCFTACSEVLRALSERFAAGRQKFRLHPQHFSITLL